MYFPADRLSESIALSTWPVCWVGNSKEQVIAEAREAVPQHLAESQEPQQD